MPSKRISRTSSRAGKMLPPGKIKTARDLANSEFLGIWRDCKVTARNGTRRLNVTVREKR